KRPRWTRACSRVKAKVLLPEADSPVNHKVAPFCFSNSWRSARPTCPSCQVMLVAFTSVMVAPGLFAFKRLDLCNRFRQELTILPRNCFMSAPPWRTGGSKIDLCLLARHDKEDGCALLVRKDEARREAALSEQHHHHD